ncbi:MAG: NADH-quinone oxidoreductase subunit NuoE [Bacteroidales bacterium]|nr:NADH-quinone oxidoreductase subunit NuoE [Bacteroidales bacterium]
MRIARIAPKTEALNAESIDLQALHPLIKKYKGKKGAIIPLLQGIQSVYGFLPRAAMDYIAKECAIEPSELFGVATFYAQFRMNPVGKHIIKVCHGTACHVQNANAITDAIAEALGISDGETTPDKLFTLESVACLGCCSLAPVMMIDEETYGKLTRTKAVRIIKNIKIADNQGI